MFRVSGKNMDMGEALRSRINARLVTIEKEAFGFRTECVVHLDSGAILETDGFAADAYASADQATMRLEKRLRRYKRRLKDRPMHRGNSRGEPLEQ